MKKFLAVLAVFTMIVFVISCGGSNNKSSDNGNDYDDNNNDNGNYGGNSGDGGSSDAGIHLGIIGFNEELKPKDINLLNNSTLNNYTNFIDSLKIGDSTALEFADYTALKMMREYKEPPKLKKVVLVTFTDGLDNVSLTDSEVNPEKYSSHKEYLDSIHSKFTNEKIHGQSVEAYTIGIKGNDVKDDEMFEYTLHRLASNESNVFQVSNMDEVKQHFNKIANDLYSVSKTDKLDVKINGGYDQGKKLRFTFDISKDDDPENSKLYIGATFRSVTDDEKILENISYKGLDGTQTTISSTYKEGKKFHFQFENLKYAGTNDSLSESDLQKIVLWKQTENGIWEIETEFHPENSSIVTEHQDSALIMLVLDCTTSLGDSDFAKMQQAAKEFVRTLVGNSDSNGGNGGNGGASDNCGNHFTDGGEICDGDSRECESIDSRYTGGFAYCKTDCSGWDTTTCTENTEYSCISVDEYLWSSKTSNEMDWYEAVDYCETLYECGYSDWHLPSISELRTLIQNCPETELGGSCDVTDGCLDMSCFDFDACFACYDDSINSNSGYYSKLGDTGDFWSSSTVEGDDNAYNVGFDYGEVNWGFTKDAAICYVRCVR